MTNDKLSKFGFIILIVGIIILLAGVFIQFKNISFNNKEDTISSSKNNQSDTGVEQTATILDDYEGKDFSLSIVRIDYTENLGSAITAILTNNTEKNYDISYFEVTVSGTDINEKLVSSLKNLKNADKITIKKVTKEVFTKNLNSD